MSELGPEQLPKAGIDILQLFAEDLDQTDRIDLFKQAADRLRLSVDSLATPESVDLINRTSNLHVIFAPHKSMANYPVQGRSLYRVANGRLAYFSRQGVPP